MSFQTYADPTAIQTDVTANPCIVVAIIVLRKSGIPMQEEKRPPVEVGLPLA
jgi:hypothetical protein